MEWSAQALILGTRQHGENSVILEVMTRGYGRHLGLVRGGRSRRMQATLQPGNGVTVTWRARLETHLGQFQIEPDVMRAATFMESAVALNGMQTLAALLRLLPERDPHPGLYQAAEVIVEHITDVDVVAPLMIRFELALLEELGFGLDLNACVATGTRDDLIYVSPKSGGAVCKEAGLPYHDKMLALPNFLTANPDTMEVSHADIEAGFALSGYFLSRHVYVPRALDIPLSRTQFMRDVLRKIA